MAEKMDYEVIAERYTGKHRVYTKGQQILKDEVFGNLNVLLNGQKDAKDKRGNPLPDKDPVLKKISGTTKKASK